MQVRICNGDIVCFYDNMKQFTEEEIASVAPSEVQIQNRSIAAFFIDFP